MKFPASLLLCACLCPVAWAEKAPNAVKSSALAELNKLEQGLSSSKTKRISAAAAALSVASGSEDAALALFVKCKESAMREDGKKNGDFVDWKIKELRALSEKKAFKKGLRLNCQWAYITLKKADADRQKRPVDVSTEVSSMMDTLLRDAKEFIDDDSGSLNGNEIGLIRKILLITDVRPTSEWVDSLSSYDTIFEKILLPKQKERKSIEGFRAVWQKRIDMQQALVFSSETLSEMKQKAKDKDTKRRESGVRVRDNKPELTSKDVNFSDINPKHVEKLRDLYWRMEVDCYGIGDEQKALPKLMTYLKDTKDPALQEKRIKELKELLLAKKDSSSSSSTKRVEETATEDTYSEPTEESIEEVTETVEVEAKPAPKKTPAKQSSRASSLSEIPPTQDESPASSPKPAPKETKQEDDSVWDV